MNDDTRVTDVTVILSQNLQEARVYAGSFPPDGKMLTAYNRPANFDFDRSPIDTVLCQLFSKLGIYVECFWDRDKEHGLEQCDVVFGRTSEK